jgi:hypothetical protein
MFSEVRFISRGFSRGSFLKDYFEKEIIETIKFEVADGVHS